MGFAAQQVGTFVAGGAIGQAAIPQWPIGTTTLPLSSTQTRSTARDGRLADTRATTMRIRNRQAVNGFNATGLVYDEIGREPSRYTSLAMPDGFVNQLHFGDNLVRLRGEGVDRAIPDEVADLIYLDPPFNSARNYNLLFRQHRGEESPAQIMTFEDTWTFQPYLLQEFRGDQRNARLFDLIDALYQILGQSDMMAYLLMMAPRLLELHAKLKPTGSLYLHCDPVASHYLKIILDVIFGPENIRNEVIWQRTLAKALVTKRLPRNHDVILNYCKDAERGKWKGDAMFTKYDEGDLPAKTAGKYSHRDVEGRLYRLDNLINPNHNRPNLTYEFLGVTKVWRWTKQRMQQAYEDGLIIQSRPGSVPQLKRYLDEQRGLPLGDVWVDIPPINSQAKERRGYPTQKPLALLERIIAASTDEGDVVLDPIAGCGTAIVAAERMGRHWIGIDVTYLAINEVVTRLQEEKREGHELRYELLGTPKDENSAVALFENTRAQNHKPFEQWAVTLVNGRYNDRMGADRGVDGVIDLHDLSGRRQKGVIQVKGGNGLNLSNVRDFAHVIENTRAVFGIMISQREPTREMRLIAEAMGYANWPGQRRIPKYQFLTTRGILENGDRAIVPESWLSAPDRGVGRAVTAEDVALPFDEPD